MIISLLIQDFRNFALQVSIAELLLLAEVALILQKGVLMAVYLVPVALETAFLDSL